MRWIDLIGLPLSADDKTTKVEIEQIRQETVTDRIRARMTEGASRESCEEGRVVDEI